ncbi:hypothetical protein [uncultured Treponema sp.]|uniref:hypothetical protein n=1 Tax=uncultured Treponema sp. TaxID=162155 RepID=UPI000E8C5D75|nr:hypothetical protein [uncultured Treponema sp.]HAZ97604.1 hypothetical protein [Treponema sp.]
MVPEKIMSFAMRIEMKCFLQIHTNDYTRMIPKIKPPFFLPERVAKPRLVLKLPLDFIFIF